jgi:hypothetical protein
MNSKIKKYLCLECGGKFIPAKTNQRFCTTRCYKRQYFRHWRRTPKGKESISKYNATHHDQLLANANRYTATHRDRVNARAKVRYYQNRDKAATRFRRWEREHWEERKAYKRNLYRLKTQGLGILSASED